LIRSLGRSFFIALIIFSSGNIFASSLSSLNTNEPSAWTSSLNWNGDLNKERPEASLRSISAGYSYGLQLPGSTSLATSWIETDGYVLGLNWEFGQKKDWTSSLFLNISNQPTEKYSTSGLEFDLNHRIEWPGWKSESTEADGATEFSPGFNLGIKVGNTNLIQKSKILVRTTLVNELAEPQVKTGINLRYDYSTWGSFYSEYNGYHYSATIKTFIAFLNSSNNTSLSGMTTAMGQLNIFDWTNKLIFYLSDNWEWDLSEQISESLTTGITSFLYESSWVYKIGKSYDVEIGVGQVQPENTTEGIINLVCSY